MPLALKAIGYKLYFINGAWDILQFAFIYFMWVETRGKTLEELDEYFDGENHSDLPNMSTIGKEMSVEKAITT
jgi:hypothetical protein